MTRARICLQQSPKKLRENTTSTIRSAQCTIWKFNLKLWDLVPRPRQFILTTGLFPIFFPREKKVHCSPLASNAHLSFQATVLEANPLQRACAGCISVHQTTYPWRSAFSSASTKSGFPFTLLRCLLKC